MLAEQPAVLVEVATAADVVRALDAFAPGVASYVVDERGALRRHVNLFIDGAMVRDRRRLSDAVAPNATVHILQALSGAEAKRRGVAGPRPGRAAPIRFGRGLTGTSRAA